MLNISHHRINDKVDVSTYEAFKILNSKSVSKVLWRTILVILGLFILALFLPWTQNIRSNGMVTTLNPDDRPQSVEALIGGRIERWYVMEGDTVRRGDTIIFISEAKEEYLDPDILENTSEQINAKRLSSEAYSEKARNMDQQIEALIKTRDIKSRQNEIKINQVKLKIQSDSIDLVAAKTKNDIAKVQLDRMQQMYDNGLKPLTDLEAKRLSLREAQAKVLEIENKLLTNANELVNLESEKTAIINEYGDKIAKARAEKMSALSSKYDADATTNKLQSSYNIYNVRQQNYYITSPVDGIVTKALSTGIGEFIKSGDEVITIVPLTYELAIEMYVMPMDMPLLNKGQHVRVQFDGWPAIVFSGWPNSSYGTFGGRIFAIDNFISENGKYRILVQQEPDEEPWPRQVRVGGGVNTITLLNNVKLGYELWRQLNGFPPDFYNKADKETNKSGKAPLKKVK